MSSTRQRSRSARACSSWAALNAKPGRASTPEDAYATIALIPRTAAEVGGPAIADGLQVQYGGSVTAENFAAFIAQPEIDGALVGGASLKADQFIEIVRLANTQAIP